VNSRAESGRLKHDLSWKVGTILSFIIYFSGLSSIYKYIRCTVLKKHHAIILTYHRIGISQADHITVLQNTFDKQLRYLCKHFSVVPLNEMIRYYRTGRWPDSDLATVTFDDGYKDNLALAAELIEKHGINATVFVVSGWLDSAGMLSRADMLEMKRRCFTIGAHTVSHPRLSEIGIGKVKEEIMRSKQDLEDAVNGEVAFFAYPKGKKTDVGKDAVHMAETAGFDAAFSSENGLLNKAVDPYFLPRLGIREIPLFVFKVRVSGIFESGPFNLMRSLLRLT